MLRDRTSSHLLCKCWVPGSRAADGVASLTALGWLGKTGLAIIECYVCFQISGVICVMGGLILESPLIAASMVSS